MKWMYHRGVSDFDAMTDLSRVLRDRLHREAEIRPPRITDEQLSAERTRMAAIT